MQDPTRWLSVSPEVRDAIESGRAVVALESTVIAHGLPRPVNLETARELESIVRNGGAIPATIAVLDGKARVGLEAAELERIATDESVHKLSARDIPLAMSRGIAGATTVAATAHIAWSAGIRVFATGGIGGVHRGGQYDVSADLTQLQRTPIVVVCSGAKSILDLSATREALETLGVLLLGYRTDRLPAFYSRDSGLDVDARVDDPTEIAAIQTAQRATGLDAAILVTVPVPAGDELAQELLEQVLDQALEEANRRGIQGKEVTPFLMARIAERTGGASLRANLSLLKNNASVAAAIASAIAAR